MNTIAMVTLVGSTIVGSAQFNTWEECVVARNQSSAQAGVTATCTYRHSKENNGKQMFGAMLRAMTDMAASTCGTVDSVIPDDVPLLNHGRGH